MGSRGRRGFRFDLGNIKRVGLRPDLAAELGGTDLLALTVEDRQFLPGETAPGRASDADHELEARARHDRGRRVPDVQRRLMRLDDNGDVGRCQFLQGAVLVGHEHDGAIDVLARAARRRHDDVLRHVGVVVLGLGELGLRQLGALAVTDRNPRRAQAILAGIRDLDLQRDVGACIHFVG